MWIMPLHLHGNQEYDYDDITMNNSFFASGDLSSTDNLCKQFGPRSGPTEYCSLFGSKLFDTLIVFLKDFFEKVNFEEKVSGYNKSMKN